MFFTKNVKNLGIFAKITLSACDWCKKCSESGKSTKLGIVTLWNILIVFKGGAKNNDALLSNRC